MKLTTSTATAMASKGAQTKTIKRVLALAGAAGLLAGCASTDSEHAGAMGDQSQTAAYKGSSAATANSDSAPTAATVTGANGSISRGNPFGLDTGSGLTRAQ
jgi:hypothetical protein